MVGEVGVAVGVTALEHQHSQSLGVTGLQLHGVPKAPAYVACLVYVFRLLGTEKQVALRWSLMLLMCQWLEQQGLTAAKAVLVVWVQHW